MLSESESDSEYQYEEEEDEEDIEGDIVNDDEEIAVDDEDEILESLAEGEEED
jgi:hypothetical protein